MKKMRLAGLRVNAKLTPAYVADALHGSKSNVGKWENDITYPTAVQLQQLCDLYDCTLNDVFIPSKLSKES